MSSEESLYARKEHATIYSASLTDGSEYAVTCGIQGELEIAKSRLQFLSASFYVPSSPCTGVCSTRHDMVTECIELKFLAPTGRDRW